MRPEAERLEHHAQVAVFRRQIDPVGHRREQLAGKTDLARSRSFKPADAAQQRRLSAAAWPQQNQHLRARHVEIDTA